VIEGAAGFVAFAPVVALVVPLTGIFTYPFTALDIITAIMIFFIICVFLINYN